MIQSVIYTSYHLVSCLVISTPSDAQPVQIVLQNQALQETSRNSFFFGQFRYLNVSQNEHLYRFLCKCLMLKVCHFNSNLGMEGGGYIYLPLNFCHKIKTATDFSQNFLTFNFYGKLKRDIRSLRYVSRCFVE